MYVCGDGAVVTTPNRLEVGCRSGAVKLAPRVMVYVREGSKLSMVYKATKPQFIVVGSSWVTTGAAGVVVDVTVLVMVGVPVRLMNVAETVPEVPFTAVVVNEEP